MKKAVKIIIDILMFVCFLFLMSYGATRNLNGHAHIGITLFILFIIHHVMNRWFYKALTKGAWNAQRIILNTTDWILFALMIVMAISSVLMSGLVFEWSPIRTTQGYRELHLCSCCWGFMVMLIHLGLHLNGKLNKFENFCIKKCGNICGKIAPGILYIAAIAAGVYGFIKSQLYVYMFITGGWKLAPESLTIAILQLLGISVGMCALTHLALKVRPRVS